MASASYLLVVDVGTGSGRSLIFDSAGAQVAVAQREWTHPPDPAYPGANDFESKANWQLLCDCIRKSIDIAGIAPQSIAAVSATSMRQGIVCFDAVGDEIFAVPNIDARADAETIALLNQGWGPKVYEIQGDWPSNHALARIRWLKNHKPAVFDRLAMMTMLADWVIYRLSGVYCTEPSGASSSGMFDIAARQWSETLTELAGLESAQLPPVSDPGTPVGAVTAQAAHETGLAENTPVVLGPADTQAGYVGTGVVSSGEAGLVIGSFALPSIVSDKPLLDSERRVRTQCHAPEGQWIIESCSFYTGLAVRWFRDAFCQAEIERGREIGIDPYDLMNQQAEQVPPGSYGMQVIMSNVANNSHWVHASPTFLNFDILDPDHYNKATFYRALIENTAYQILGELENIVSVAGAWPDSIAFSGGAAKSDLWAQIMADTLNIPVRVPAIQEATALGAAIYAALGVGLYDDLNTVTERFVHWATTYEPDASRHAVYREAYERWRKIYPHMLKLVERGLAQPMWKAPGTGLEQLD